eukprot:Skav228836  [mRNA]  locus=scaffold4680:30395:31525:+ [translate_table: standard]
MNATDVNEIWGPETVRQGLIAKLEHSVLQLLIYASRGVHGELPREELGGRANPAANALTVNLQKLVGGTSGQRLRLRRVMALMDSVHGLLCSGRTATPRELYYRHVSLFPRQQLSDDLLKFLCQTLEVPRHYLRLVGTAKGLVRGHMRILEPRPGHADGSVWVDGMDPLEPRGHSISPISAHTLKVETVAQKVFVVEKETVFHRLIDEGFLEKHKPCVLVTARGFPDVPTRYFLRQLRESCGSPDIYLLVDFDPSGLVIAATYAFGPEGGCWMHDDLSLSCSMPLICRGGVEGACGFGLRKSDVITMTARDRALAKGLQRRLEQIQRRGKDSDQFIESYQDGLRHLLQGGMKYELDALEKLPEFVADLVRKRAHQQ